MLNYLWLGLVISAVFLAGWSGQYQELVNAAFQAAKSAVMDIALPLGGMMALWLGMMRLAEKAGLISLLAVFLRPVLKWLFPEVPSRHPAMGAIVMNTAANMIGLSNAATPIGLRAMQHLEKINPHPGTASNAMCTFLAINTSSVQLIPATAVATLAAAGAKDPTAIIGTAFAATVCSTIAGLFAVKTLERLPAYRLPVPEPARVQEIEREREESEQSGAEQPLPSWAKFVLLLFFAGFLFFAVRNGIAALQAGAESGADAGSGTFSAIASAAMGTISQIAVPFVFAFFPLIAFLKSIPVYEEFVEGAKEGIQVALRIIPFLVAILCAIGMFRAVGGIDLLTGILGGLLATFGVPAEVFPVMMVRPLSGGGAFALFTEIANTHGGDSFVARLAGTILGSTETTFYVIAVYFGSVAVRRTRHAVPAGLFADVVGMSAAVIVCNLVFER